MPKILGAGSVVCLMAAHQAAASLTTDYGIGYSGVYTNNIYRSANNKQQEGINMVTGLLSLRESSARTQLSIDSEVQGRQYWRHSYGSGALYGLDAAGEAVVLPKRFTMTLDDVFTQAPIDPMLVLSPANRQNVNAFSVGPNFFVYFDPIDMLTFGGRYENDYYQFAPTSGHRALGYVRLQHAMSRHSDVSLNFEPSRVYYRDTTLNPDYTRKDTFFRLHAHPYETSFNVDVGHTSINEQGLRPLSGLLLRGAVRTQVTQKTSFELSGRREYGDAGRYALIVSPLINVPTPLVTNPAQLVSGGLYLGRYYDGRYLYRRQYGTDRIHLFAWRLNYITSPLSQELHGGTLNLGYDYSDAWTASLFGGYVRTQYLSFARTDHDAIGGPGLRYRITPQLNVDLESIWDRRTSTVPGQGFVEWRGVLSITYNTSPTNAVENPFLSNQNMSYFINR